MPVLAVVRSGIEISSRAVWKKNPSTFVHGTCDARRLLAAERPRER